MKTFFSELSANPAYYSFGYSVYGMLEPSDRLDAIYEQGYLPFVGAKEQPSPMVYLARGTRIVATDFVERHYHKRVLRKAEEGNGLPETIVHEKKNFPITNEFIQFFLSYFAFRFGKDSMSEERLRAILAAPFITHITEYKSSGKTVAYLLEVHGDSFIHVWYHAYTKEREQSYLGLYLYIDVLRRAKAEGKQHVYLGVTYGNWMLYKTNFEPLQYFDGATWVIDPKSRELKKLLKGDPTRILGFVDAWREKQKPYYEAPYPFAGGLDELRFLAVMLAGTPRVFLVLFCIVFLLAGVFLVPTLF